MNPQKKSLAEKQFNILTLAEKRQTQHFLFLQKWYLKARGINHTADWVEEAEWAKIAQTPLRARKLLYFTLFAVIALLIWSALAKVDEIARASGRVIPSSQLQTVQALDGGLVQHIVIREGQIVEEGQLLLQLDPTRVTSSLGESRALLFALQAEVSRLRALAQNQPITFPDELLNDMPALVMAEQRLYQTSLAEFQQQQGALSEQIEQKQQELNEAQAAVEQYTQIIRFSERELAVTRPLISSGAVSDIDILRLERDLARAQGELNRSIANVNRATAAVREAEQRKTETELTVLNRWQTQLAESESKLAALLQAQAGLTDKVRQSEIRSPVRGTIQRLHINTVGGVITAGREVVDIVPLDDTLEIEAKIAPSDIAFIKVGQPAVLRFSAYDFSVFGGLAAEVSHISADTITDEKDITYYLIRLKTKQQDSDAALLIIPGMTAEVDIMTGKKSILSYLVKPFSRARHYALTER